LNLVCFVLFFSIFSGRAVPVETQVPPPAPWFHGYSATSTGKTIQVSEGGSIARAMEEAAPGDTIQLAPGTFHEAVVFTKSGAEDAPITLRGSLSASGEKLTRITTATELDPAGWLPAPNVGPGVYRYGQPLDFRVKSLTAHGRQIAPVHAKTGGRSPDLTAWDVLAWPDDYRVASNYTSLYVSDGIPFWETMQAIYYLDEKPGKADGQTIYLRFWGGHSPAEDRIEAYTEGAAITLDNAAHVVIADCEIHGGTSGIKISGANAQYNEIRNCDLFYGTDRVMITGQASRNVIRHCRLQKRFLGGMTGAWAGADRLPDAATRKQAAIKSFFYTYYKYWASAHKVSDDRSITLQDTHDNLIWDNELDGGLIGISITNASDILLQGNRVLHHSSVGTIVRTQATRIQFDRNDFEDNGINFRVQSLNMDSGRVVWITRNKSLLPEGLGNHVYGHSEGAPVRAEDAPQVFIIQNTFRGGNHGLLLPPAAIKEGLPNFILLDNVFALGGSLVAPPRLQERNGTVGAFDDNLIIQAADVPVPTADWFGKNNIVTQDPDAQPPKLNFHAPWKVRGRTFEPIPNMD